MKDYNLAQAPLNDIVLFIKKSDLESYFVTLNPVSQKEANTLACH